MVFRPSGSKVFKLRVVLSKDRSATCTTGCVTKEDAAAVELVVNRWRGKEGKKYARADVLALIIDKRITLVDAYDAHNEGTLDLLVERATAEASVVDLDPHVTAWHTEKSKAKKGAASADAYRTQVRVLFPASAPFTLDQFTRKEIKARIDALKVDAPTKNRYKAAISSFAKYLIDAELLETNVVRDIAGFGENDPRVVYYERPDAKKLIGGLGQPLAAIAAIACGFCAEWCALETMTAADLDLTKGRERAYLRGSKRSTRRRWVPLVDENRWLLSYMKAAVAGKVGAAPLFAGMTESRALRGIQKVARALEVVAVGEDLFGQHTLHDWRHTHIVQLLRDGYSEQIAASHGGHKNTDMVRTKYGVFIPTREDYARPKQQASSRAHATRAATARK